MTYPVSGVTPDRSPLAPLAPIYTGVRRFQLESFDATRILEGLRERFAPPSKVDWPGESHLFEFMVSGRRLSILSHSPLYTLSLFGSEAALFDHTEGHRYAIDGPLEGGGLTPLRDLLAAYRDPLSGLEGLAQSMLIMLGYDAARGFEPKLGPGRPLQNLPQIWATIPALSLAFDHGTRRGVLVANALRGAAESSVLDRFETQVRRASRSPRPAGLSTRRPLGLSVGPPRMCTSRERYAEAVSQAREYIKAGDIFQVVLSLEAVLDVAEAPLEIYRRMSRVNRRTANFLVESGDFSVVGASPEILLEKKGKNCIIKPLAGTLPHLGDRSSAAEARLLNNRKDCAEHRMLVDLARNDLGRVCRYGSVAPHRLMEAEYFYNVIHIASEIRGRIRDDRDALHLLEAGFPAGTMTGAPKIRAMEIIDQLERRPRGFYSGGIGFVTPNDDLYTYIMIRCLTLIDGRAYSRAGAGIVYDSRADHEYDECLSKLENALRACRATAQGLGQGSGR